MNDQILGNSLEQRKLADSYYMEGSDESLNLASVWYQTAAVQGDSQAEYMLGLMYYQGCGFRKDYDSAYRWFIKSCKNGNKNAQYTMGFMLQKGVGLKKSQKKAFE